MTTTPAALREAPDAEFLRDLARRIFQKATPAMGFDQGDTDQLYRIARSLDEAVRERDEARTARDAAYAKGREDAFREAADLRAALEPFASLAEGWVGDDEDDEDEYRHTYRFPQTRVRVGWLRAAARALETNTAIRAQIQGDSA